MKHAAQLATSATLDAVRANPYLALLAGFTLTVGYGLCRLYALLQGVAS